MRGLIVTFLLLLLGCEPHHDQSKKSQLTKDDVLKLLESPKNITYKDVEQVVLKPYCVKCHSSLEKKGNIALESYDDLLNNEFTTLLSPFFPKDSAIYHTIISTGENQMPPKGERQPLEYEKQLLYLWITNGAPLDASSSAQGQPISIEKELKHYYENPETIDYKAVNKYVFSTSCNSCHSQNGSKPSMDAIMYSADLTNYQRLTKGFAKPIKPGFPDESSLYVAAVIDQTMPPEEEGYKLLNPYRAKLLRLWILNCAIEDYSKIENEELNGKKPGREKLRLCEGQ